MICFLKYYELTFFRFATIQCQSFQLIDCTVLKPFLDHRIEVLGYDVKLWLAQTELTRMDLVL